MGILYANNGKIYASDYTEIYVPSLYFNNLLAESVGAAIKTFGIVYIRSFEKGKAGELKLINIPTTVEFMVYETSKTTIDIGGKKIDTTVLKYLKDAYVMHQTIPKGRDVASAFLDSILAGKLPENLSYNDLINFWWTNIRISGVSYKVPSKIFEMVLTEIYRNPSNTKERFGPLYGKGNTSPFGYKTGSVRAVVKDLSTFSGMVYENIGDMITNGINNSIDNIEEPESPLEKIIHY